MHFLAGDDQNPGELKIDNAPAPILMVGLQGSGKTTTTAKLAKRLKEKHGKRVLMASLDIYRPAAQDQLAVLGAQVGVDTLPIVKGQSAVDIAKRAKQQATLGGYDVYMLDTAGRLHIDETLMQEVEDVRNVTNPRETMLVVDGLTGQDAVNVAEQFDGQIGISGVVLTRMDGDGRGGVRRCPCVRSPASRSNSSALAKRWTRLRNSTPNVSQAASLVWATSSAS